MRGRATSLRKLSISSPPGRRSFTDYKGNKPKALQQQKGEDGNIFYTVSKWGEGRGMPSPQSRDAQTSFLISNLLLDLDAYEVAGVRPYDTQDEERYTDYFKSTGRRSEVSENMKELVKLLNQNRWNSEKLVLHPTHPKRLTDGDIMSAALREPTKGGLSHAQSKSVHTSPTFEGTDGAERTYDIQVLNNVHVLPDRDSSRRSSLRKTTTAGKPNPNDELEHVLSLGDNTLRQSSFMKEARQANGIPDYATHDDEQHIRWMLLRHHNSAFVADKTSSINIQDVVTAITSVQEQDGKRTVEPSNITSIRRIIFHALGTGVNLKPHEPWNGKKESVALQIQESIRAVLEAYPRRKHLFYETLTLANNLQLRPEIRENNDFAFAILSLRLQATAGLGNLPLMATYLDQGVEEQSLKSDSATLKDVGAVLKSLDAMVKKADQLQGAQDRAVLFRILTGHNATGPAQGESIRKLILHGDIWKAGEFQKRRLSVLMSYISLLGRIGGLRVLWSEWRTARRLVGGAKSEAQTTQDAARKLVVDGFKAALRQGKSSHRTSSTIDGSSFEALAISDSRMIEQRSEVSTETEPSWSSKTNQELEKMMDLPFDQWVKEMGV